MKLELRIPRRLESPNKSRGSHWRVRHRIRQTWEDELRWALAGMPGNTWLDAVNFEKGQRARVTVERHVPSGRNFIRDDDNLRFCVKPLLDAMKRLGYIKNDSRKWLDHPTPTQHVSADGKDWTVVVIEPADVPH
jgi:hypothetical protein